MISNELIRTLSKKYSSLGSPYQYIKPFIFFFKAYNIFLDDGSQKMEVSIINIEDETLRHTSKPFYDVGEMDDWLHDEVDLLRRARAIDPASPVVPIQPVEPSPDHKKNIERAMKSINELIDRKRLRQRGRVINLASWKKKNKNKLIVT